MTRRILPLSCAVLCALALIFTPAAHADPPEGRWDGRIEVPGNPIEISVSLGGSAGEGWRGAIDIPAQGLAEFPLADVAVEGSSVSFAMPGIPGSPVFRGELSGDGTALDGQLSQGGATFPFRLERVGDAEVPAAPPAPPIPPEMIAALTGRWEGTLEVPGRSLRLALVLEAASGGGLTATLDSPDQGQTGMPVTRLTVEGSTLRAELSYANAAFEGTLDPSRTELEGRWQQGGSLPLTLRKQGADDDDPFPPADPESVGIPAEALELLADRARALAEEEEIVGGELVVIKDRRTVLREAFGWKDREAGEPLEAGALYCVRSMTKPLVGTAVQMLIDRDLLELDTPVHEILPAFAGPRKGRITVEHLLTHTSGLPFTTFTRPLAEYADLAEVAAEAAAADLEFEPGSGYQYSDAGSDTLGAIVAAVSGMPAEEFLRKRILDPLGMEDTVTLLGEDDGVKQRVPSAYSGGTGAWIEHWRPSDPPIFPLFLTSQSLYSTTTDYARFLAWWMDGGRLGEERLLSPEAVERALAPARPMDEYPEGLEGLEVYYGQQWMVYARPADPGPERVAFGHGGSDGTHAWAWPDLDLMVLFFTQSRGTLAGIGLERVLHTLLVEQRLDDPSLAAAASDGSELQAFAGLYWDEDVADAYYVITPRGRRLEVDRPGRMHMVFKSGDRPAHFVSELSPEVWIEFVESEAGDVTAMKTFFGRRTEHDPRHVPREGLPSVDEVIARVRQAHRVDKLPELGAVRLSGTLHIEARQVEGTIDVLFDGTRSRSELVAGAERQVVVTGGGRAWSYSTTTGVDELEGRLREQALLDHPAVRLGDWREHYEHVEVLKRVELEGDPLLLVRVVPPRGPGATMFVDEKTGRLVRKDDLVQIPGIGIIGVRTDYEDFRDVGGMQVPFRNVATFAASLIGKIVTRIEEAETGVEIADETFAPPAAGDGEADRRTIE